MCSGSCARADQRGLHDLPEHARSGCAPDPRGAATRAQVRLPSRRRAHGPRHRHTRSGPDPDPQPRARLGCCSLVAIVSLGVGAYYVMRSGVTNAALSIVARPTVLQALAVAFVVGGILWCGSIILTAVQSRPTRLDRARTRLLGGFTTLMVFLVARLVVQGRGVRHRSRRHRRRRSSADPRRHPAPARRSPRARTRGPSRPASTSCCSAPTPAPTASAPAPTR